LEFAGETIKLKSVYFGLELCLGKKETVTR